MREWVVIGDQSNIDLVIDSSSTSLFVYTLRIESRPQWVLI